MARVVHFCDNFGISMIIVRKEKKILFENLRRNKLNQMFVDSLHTPFG